MIVQYLIKQNEYKYLNILENIFLSQNEIDKICLNVHGIGSHFQPLIPNPDELEWRAKYLLQSKYNIKTYIF